MTRQDYFDACKRTGTEPVEFENQCLSSGFVPEQVQRERGLDEPGTVYWAWLVAQVEG